MALGLAGCSAPIGNARLSSVTPGGDGVLRIGVILDNAGSSAFLNESELAAAKLAVKQINDAGGYKGHPVELLPASAVNEGSSASQGASAAAFTADTAAQAKALLAAHADVVVGPTDSSHAPAAIDVMAPARIPLISPANTASGLSSYRSGGFYFRTSATDAAQGSVLAKLAHDAGAKRLSVLHEAGDYGIRVSGAVMDAARNLGMDAVSNVEFAAGKAAPAAASIKSGTPDAVVVVARGGAQGALAELLNAGLSGKKLLLSDGAIRQYGTALGAGGLDGARGILPGVFPSVEFQAGLTGIDPKLKDTTYAAETYDAVTLAALAAAAANDDAGASIAAWLTTVSGGVRPTSGDAASKERTSCASYKDCVEVLKGAKLPDYDGESGTIGFDANGDVTSSNYMVFTYGADNTARVSGKETASRTP
ncbi:ABC transporter substrate-binding protein [Arthrobacter sp. AZCC_0090]|uniref:ABC transporter substrate-binding protein n=1 Tax=Arthrobacter sp. AZCC_0090 TaxID=2735881 RepID=UPI0017AB4A63|nr:ABC transporter substrate-binding protein [Arthrobacter sp. AZCC_0090]MBB6404411.1 branched-chain amino acid transport system substrate-binding protein [Arthrobacter sp. AZCC_0090]